VARREESKMSTRSPSLTVEEGLRLSAGAFVLTSLALGHWLHPGFYLFTAFVGANLLQSAFTRWCPMMWLLERAGLPRTRAVEA
jgi:hypothetical protein